MDTKKKTIFAFDQSEIKLFRGLNTPAKVQDFLETLEFNFERQGQTCMSPRRVLRERKAHCMEGAMLAAAVLEFHGHQPLLVDLRAARHDYDHVVAVFKQFGCFGAIGKTNHAVLRYREPVYRTVRELAMSFFHEYFDDRGRKNLREYSLPFSLRQFDRLGWRTTEADLWDVPYRIDRARHAKILKPGQLKNLRPADPIEIKAGQLRAKK